MIKLIIGEKGTGKTKKLVSIVNEAAESSNGSVICLEKGNVLTYNISHKIRLIDIEQYGISGYDQFIGFVNGLCAGNYDITDIVIDSTLKIGGKDMADFAAFIDKLKVLADSSNVKFVLSVSADISAVPQRTIDLCETL